MRSKSLNKTLVTCFICIGLLPVLLLAVASFQVSRNAIEAQAFNQLSSVNEIKRSTISDYFRTIERQVQTLSSNLMIVDAMADFKASFGTWNAELAVQLPSESDMRTAVRMYYRD